MSGAVRPTLAELESFATRFNAGAMMRHLGLLLSYPEPDLVVVSLPVVRPEHRGGMGTHAINGGILSAMFDFALGCTSMLAGAVRQNATVQLSIVFQRAVRGGSARCEARLDRTAKHLLFSSAQIKDEAGEVCARATAVVSLGRELTLEQWAAALENPWEEGA